MTFNECVLYCAENKELIENFDRLRGTNLSRRGSPIELMIDDSTGRLQHDLSLFCAFVFEFVWIRLPLTCLPDASFTRSG